MAAAQRRNLQRQMATLYAWIATIAGREELITVDLPVPGGIGIRPLLLVADTRPEAIRYGAHARRYLDAHDGAVARVDLREFSRAGKPISAPPVATLRAPQPQRRT